MIDESVSEGDFSEAVAKEVKRLVDEKAAQKKAKVPAANPAPPPPVSSSARGGKPARPPKASATSAAAAAPAAAPKGGPKGGLSTADKEAASSEADDLWKEMEAGNMAIDEVQEVQTF